MISCWNQLVHWVTVTYQVNSYIFIFLYLLSIPVYWWGLYEIAAGSPMNRREKIFNWSRITKGVLINRAAWVLPYLYVMIVARKLPSWLWLFLVIMIILSTTYFFIQVYQGKARDKLPKFLKKRLKEDK